MIRKDSWRILAVSITLLSLPFIGCQDYGFEELPSSVVRENRATTVVHLAPKVDILFMIDNSNSMTNKQHLLAESFGQLSLKLDKNFEAGKYNIAVVTTGMSSSSCPKCYGYATECQSCDGQCTQATGCDGCGIYGDACIRYDSTWSCINGTGENGKFQDYIGYVDTTNYSYRFIRQDTSCRIITSANQNSCFYNSDSQEGIVFVGDRGCGVERGLEAMRSALTSEKSYTDLIHSYNAGFLRDDAELVVIIISDEEDCGKPGDVDESIPGIGADVCYFASSGINGASKTPYTGKPLEPVETYYNFLLNLKNNQNGMVKFAAIVGITDVNNPDSTIIKYDYDGNTYKQPTQACNTKDFGNCSGSYCDAKPGTRYIKLARMFGDFGFLDTICKADFSDTMANLGTFIGCPKSWTLSQPILDPQLANILINGDEVPRDSWEYDSVHDTISFIGNYDPCSKIKSGDVTIELVYATE